MKCDYDLWIYNKVLWYVLFNSLIMSGTDKKNSLIMSGGHFLPDTSDA